MRVYLDNCCVQRPLDTKTRVQVTLESEAMICILSAIEADRIELVVSDVLRYEASRNPIPARREFAERVLALGKHAVGSGPRVEQRALVLTGFGLSPLDALHLASAEVGDADYFCTCDYSLVQKAQRIKDLRTKVVSPLTLIQEVVL